MLRRLYPPGANWANGGQFNELLEAVGNFIAAFQSVGFELMVFFDGATDEIKLEEYFRRKCRDLSRIRQTLEHVGKFGQQPDDVYIPPNVIREGLAQCFKTHGCRTVFSIGEADREIAAYCMENNCFGVLGFDSDFYLFDLPRYLSSESLTITPEAFTAISYEKDKVLRVLGLESATELILVGCLVGNDFMEMSILVPFHQYILGEGLTGWDMRWKLIVSISRIISDIRQSFVLASQRSGSDAPVDINEVLLKLPVVCDSPSLAESIRKAMRQYQFRTSADLAKNLLHQRNLDQLPEIVIQRFHQGHVNPGLMCILYRRTFMKGAILGSPYRNHSLLSTRPIRVAAYTVIFGKGAGAQFLGLNPSSATTSAPTTQPSVGTGDPDNKLSTFFLINERLGISPYTVRNPEIVPVPMDPKSELPNFLEIWNLTSDHQFEAMLRFLAVSPASPVWGFWLRRKRVDQLARQFEGLPRWSSQNGQAEAGSQIDYSSVDLVELFPGLVDVPDSHKLYNEPVPASQVRYIHQQVLRSSQGMRGRGERGRGIGRGLGRGQSTVREYDRLMMPAGQVGQLEAPLNLATPSPQLDCVILLTLTLSYLWTHKLVDRCELIALLYAGLLCGSGSVFKLPEGEQQRRRFISVDGMHIGSLFLRASEDILLLNNACGNPLQIEGPWCYFDGALTQYFLNSLRQATPKPPFMMDGQDNATSPESRVITEGEEMLDQGSLHLKADFPDVLRLASLLKSAISFYKVLPTQKEKKTEDEESLELLEVDFHSRLMFASNLQNEEYQRTVVTFWKKACVAGQRSQAMDKREGRGVVRLS